MLEYVIMWKLKSLLSYGSWPKLPILNFDADIGKLTLIENIVHAFKYLLYPVLNNDLSSDVILIRIREAVCVQIVEL